ncbi:MAG: TauD/TfdA family dioxygenase [Pseudomonadota bacterium]
MTPSNITAINHAAAWQTAQIGALDNAAIGFEHRHIEALKSALERWPHPLDRLDLVSTKSFQLSEIESEITQWKHELDDGRGLVAFKGFPVDDFGPSELRLVYLGLGCHFGRPTSQSAMGDLVGDVINIGDKDRNERAYRSRRKLQLHTDRCDHIGMLCIRPALNGGESSCASALAIHNVMLEERPDLLACLYNGYFHHRFGEQAPGEPPVTPQRIPIFSFANKVATVIFIRGYIDLAVKEGHVALSDDELAALNYFDDVANRPEIRLDYMMQAGDLNFMNNCHLLHSRSEFVDSDDPAKKRHLLRLWLRDDGRPISQGAALHKGHSGIIVQDGKGTYYEGATA